MIGAGQRATLVVAGLLALVATGCWTVPGAGPERSGHNPHEYGLSPANVATLEPDWTWQAEWDTEKRVLDPVTSAAGVHVAVGHKLVTVDPVTGTERWRALLFDPALTAPLPIVAGSPSVEDGTVFVPLTVARGFSPSGTHAYRAETGEHLGNVAPTTPEVSVPRGGRLVGTWAQLLLPNFGAAAYWVTDRSDPTKSWSAYLATGNIPAVTPTSAAVGDEMFFFAYGSTLFAYPLSQPSTCTPVSPGASQQTCTPTWSAVFGSGLTRPTLSHDGALLFVGDAGHLWAFQASTGGPMWSGPLPTSEPPSAPPSVDDAHVFVPTAGKLVAFARNGCGAAACNPQWSAETGGLVRHQPAIAGGIAYTATTTGVLRAFSADGCGAPTCPPLWEHDLGSQVSGAPAVSNGRLFVGMADGRLISFAPTS